MILVDAYIYSTPIGILTSLESQNDTSLLLQNVGFFAVMTAVEDIVLGKVLLAGGTSVTVDSWGFGLVVNSTGTSSFVNAQKIPAMNRSESLFANFSWAATNNLYTRRRPTYLSIGQSQIFDVKAYGAVGDGTTDDTAALNSVLAIAANLSSIVFVPFGVYIITDTLHVPLGSRIIGQAWSQIMARGAKFQNITNPKVAVQVGNAGDVGVVEIQDLLFTVSGPTAGAVLVEWNVHESAQGSAGLWGKHPSFC